MLGAYQLFIVVKEDGPFDFIAAFNPKCLAKKISQAIAVTYKSVTFGLLSK